jgi:hypothetical protein
LEMELVTFVRNCLPPYPVTTTSWSISESSFNAILKVGFPFTLKVCV